MACALANYHFGFSSCCGNSAYNLVIFIIQHSLPGCVGPGNEATYSRNWNYLGNNYKKCGTWNPTACLVLFLHWDDLCHLPCPNVVVCTHGTAFVFGMQCWFTVFSLNTKTNYWGNWTLGFCLHNAYEDLALWDAASKYMYWDVYIRPCMLYPLKVHVQRPGKC